MTRLEEIREILEKQLFEPRGLTNEEQRRHSKLLSILELLRRGKNVQNRQLQRWLTSEEYEQFELEWDEQKGYRKELKEKPDEIKQYEEILKKATFFYNRGDSYSNKGKSASARMFFAKSESYCEKAVENLQELLSSDMTLHIWFDRECDFEHGSLISSGLENLPRVVTSRSIDRKNGDMRLMSKQEVKLSVVERAIRKLG